MPLDPTLMDLDNLNPINSPSAASNKYVKVILFALCATTAIVAIGYYFYEKKFINAKSK
jgi:hypothetical protein